MQDKCMARVDGKICMAQIINTGNGAREIKIPKTFTKFFITEIALLKLILHIPKSNIENFFLRVNNSEIYSKQRDLDI